MAVRSKYRNKKTISSGIKFHSKKEARYYEYLKHLHVREREQVIMMYHQFNQKDWDEYHKSQSNVLCSEQLPGPV